jgi:hypothetical protein
MYVQDRPEERTMEIPSKAGSTHIAFLRHCRECEICATSAALCAEGVVLFWQRLGEDGSGLGRVTDARTHHRSGRQPLHQTMLS